MNVFIGMVTGYLFIGLLFTYAVQFSYTNTPKDGLRGFIARWMTWPIGAYYIVMRG